MNILAIDTSSSLLSLCIQSKGEIRALCEHNSSQGCDTDIIPLIDALCNEAALKIGEVSLCICGLGPGSFTGLRISLAVVKGFMAALHIPAVGLSLLDAWAYRYRTHKELYLAMVPSTSTRYFARLYREGEAQGDFFEDSYENIEKEAALSQKHTESRFTSGLIDERIIHKGINGRIESQVAAALIPKGVLHFQQGMLLDDQAAPLYVLNAHTRISKRARFKDA